MKEIIDHNNYEDYFLLYVDDELDADEKKAVELFAAQHPDLEPVLEALLQTRTKADDSVIFPDKPALLRRAPLISDEVIILYLDGEPVDDGIKAALQNPEPGLQQRMELFKKTIAVPDTTQAFSRKNILYRHATIIRLRVWKMVVAAAMLLLVVGYGLFEWQKGPESLPTAFVNPHSSKAGTNAQGRVISPDASGAVAGIGPEQKAPVLKRQRVRKNSRAADQPDARLIASAGYEKPDTAQPGRLPPPPNVPVVAPAQEVVTGPVLKERNRADERLRETSVANTASAKEKKSIFKKLMKRIEDKVTGSFDDGDGQVTVAGFAFNVNQRR